MDLTKNIYFIQDSDRPMHVIAHTWQKAIDTWKSQIGIENAMNASEVSEPDGISLVASNPVLCDEISLPDWIESPEPR